MNISDIPVVVPNAKLVTKKTMEVDLMNKYKLSIWGRNFELPLLYECYHDEEVIESQRDESDIIGLSQKAFKHLDASMMI